MRRHQARYPGTAPERAVFRITKRLSGVELSGFEPLIERVNPPATEAAALPAALRLLARVPDPTASTSPRSNGDRDRPGGRTAQAVDSRRSAGGRCHRQ